MLPPPDSEGRIYWGQALRTTEPPEWRAGRDPSCGLPTELARDSERLAVLVGGTDTDVATMGDTDWFPPGFFLHDVLGSMSETDAPPPEVTLAPPGYYEALAEEE